MYVATITRQLGIERDRMQVECVMCTHSRHYDTTHHRTTYKELNVIFILDLPFCNGPLGMENGKISDSQITATTFLSTNEPFQARFRHSGSWCPTTANQVNKSIPYYRKLKGNSNINFYFLI